MDSCLLLDLGNSRGKWLHVVDEAVASEGAASLEELPAKLAFLPARTQVAVSSVVSEDREATLRDHFRSEGWPAWFARSPAALDGLVNGYVDTASLGVDRWLAMLGAWQRCRGEAVCVIDVGSALTIDFIGRDGRHGGGYILPGADLMRRSLLSDTGRVRFEEAAFGAPSRPGRSTAAAVNNGIRLALAGAVRGALDAREGREPLRVLLCGGGARMLAGDIGTECSIVPRLVFEGLLRQAKLEGLNVPEVGLLKGLDG